jgi:hypothetical protein
MDFSRIVKKIKDITPREGMLLYLVSFFFLSAAIINLRMHGEQQFSYQAESFLHGKLFLMEKPGTWYDSVFYKGHFYWPLGFFPSLLLIPFSFLFVKFADLFFYQGYLQIFLSLAIFYLCYLLAKKIRYKTEDAVLLAFAFCFASVYHLAAFIPWSWYFANTVTVLFLFLTILEYYNKRRYWLIGTFMSFALMTRFTASIGVIFFYLGILTENDTIKKKLINSVNLTVPIVLGGIILLTLNRLRFDSFFNNGYMLVNNVLMSESERYELLNYGLFQIRNIPTNLYYYFIKGLEPVLVNFKSLAGNTYVLKFPYVKVSYPGTSFFVISPIFLYIFKTAYKIKEVKNAIIASLCVLFVLLTYFWPGWRQTGPRYMLDFLPFVYLILLYSFKGNELSRLAKSVIVISSVFNLYLLLTIFSSF